MQDNRANYLPGSPKSSMPTLGEFGRGVGAALSIYGGYKAAKGIEKTGKRAYRQGLEQNINSRMAAIQAFAVGQRSAIEADRQAKIVASRAVAVAAAGGYSEDIDNLLADIYGEGAYQVSLELHAAETEANRLRLEGEQALQYGKDMKKESKKRAKAARISGLAGAMSFL